MHGSNLTPDVHIEHRKSLVQELASLGSVELQTTGVTIEQLPPDGRYSAVVEFTLCIGGDVEFLGRALFAKHSASDAEWERGPVTVSGYSRAAYLDDRDGDCPQSIEAAASQACARSIAILGLRPRVAQLDARYNLRAGLTDPS